MLILTRRPGESLILELPTGERIKVTVLEVKGNQIRIGTDAPDDIAIVGRNCWRSYRLSPDGLQRCNKKASASEALRR